MASTSRSGQSTSGGSELVAGSPSRSTAVGARCRASTRALMKCVVPIITARMSSGANGRCFRRLSRVALIPEETSGWVADFTAPITW